MDLGLFFHFARLRMRERMEYRMAYLTGILAQIIGWGGEYMVVWMVLHRFRTLNEWTWPEVAFLFSLQLLTYALGASFVFSAMVELEPMVAQGEFDTVLVTPVDPLLYLAARKYNVGYVAHILLASGFLLWCTRELSVSWTPLSVAYLAGAVIGGACIQAAALIAVGSRIFGSVRLGGAFSLYFSVKEFASFPMSLYGPAIQWVLTFVIPLAFINFYPASMLLGKRDGLLRGPILLAAPAVGPALLWGASRLFKSGISRYQGAGS
jgi:ABC-2 type transport system permease protein